MIEFLLHSASPQFASSPVTCLVLRSEKEDLDPFPLPVGLHCVRFSITVRSGVPPVAKYLYKFIALAIFSYEIIVRTIYLYIIIAGAIYLGNCYTHTLIC